MRSRISIGAARSGSPAGCWSAERAALDRQAAVCIIGPRQVGKTTLALQVARERASFYLDLEPPQDRARLQAVP
ncbi:MAG: AAA family ATPase [Rubrivivax sp.]